MRIPIIGVDPYEIGPWDLVRLKASQLREWSKQPIVSVGLVASGVLLLIGAWQSGIGWPGIPNWGWVALVSSGLGIGASWFVGKDLAAELHNPDMVHLSVLNVYSGDQRIVKVPPETFADATIVNHQWDGGEPTEDHTVGRERLKEVMINGIRCYEVDSYDPVLNVAKTSWQAHRSNNDIRTDHDEIEHIKTEQDYQIDKVYELLANETQTIRAAVAVQANKLIRVAQDVELPEGSDIGVHDSLNELFDDQGLADDLRDEKLDNGSELDVSDNDDQTEIDIK